MRNVHSRELPAAPSALAPLIDGLAGPDDVLWPSGWPPLRFDRPLGVGATGGHGPIRYSVSEYEPGRRVRCAFPPSFGTGGFHEFRVEAAGQGRARLVHELAAAPRGRMRLAWPVAIRWLHDALIEEALDNAERHVTGDVAAPAHRSPWVRTLRRASARGAVKRVAVPSAAAENFGTTDLADAYAVPTKPGAPRTAKDWLDATFGNPPGWVRTALAIRQALVPLIGVERAPRDTFRPSALSERAATIDADAGHLRFRAELTIDERTVTLATLARASNRRGRLYLAVVKRVHPLVVRSMLSRASAVGARG